MRIADGVDSLLQLLRLVESPVSDFFETKGEFQIGMCLVLVRVALHGFALTSSCLRIYSYALLLVEITNKHAILCLSANSTLSS
jgi:hypothetical protein